MWLDLLKVLRFYFPVPVAGQTVYLTAQKILKQNSLSVSLLVRVDAQPSVLVSLVLLSRSIGFSWDSTVTS